MLSLSPHGPLHLSPHTSAGTAGGPVSCPGQSPSHCPPKVVGHSSGASLAVHEGGCQAQPSGCVHHTPSSRVPGALRSLGTHLAGSQLDLQPSDTLVSVLGNVSSGLERPARVGRAQAWKPRGFKGPSSLGEGVWGGFRQACSRPFVFLSLTG